MLHVVSMGVGIGGDQWGSRVLVMRPVGVGKKLSNEWEIKEELHPLFQNLGKKILNYV